MFTIKAHASTHKLKDKPNWPLKLSCKKCVIMILCTSYIP